MVGLGVGAPESPVPTGVGGALPAASVGALLPMVARVVGVPDVATGDNGALPAPVDRGVGALEAPVVATGALEAPVVATGSAAVGSGCDCTDFGPESKNKTFSASGLKVANTFAFIFVNGCLE